MGGKLRNALRPPALLGLAAAMPLAAASQCDLEVDLEVSDPEPASGEEKEVQVSVTNNEPVSVPDVSVEVEMPATRVEVVDADPSHGRYSASEGVWEVGELASGRTAELLLTVEVRELEPGEEP